MPPAKQKSKSRVSPRFATIAANFGRAVTLARESLGLSRQALAEQCGASYQLVRLIEEGETNPSIGVAVTIATILRIDLNTLRNKKTPA